MAERLLDEAMPVLRDAGPWFLSLVAYLRAVLAVQRGAPDEAIVLIRESLTRIRELKDKFAFVYATVPLAAAAVLKGDDAWAAWILGARDAVTDSTGLAYVDNSAPDVLETLERDAPARFGAAQWAEAYAAGRTVSVETLLKDLESRAASERLLGAANIAIADNVLGHPAGRFVAIWSATQSASRGSRLHAAGARADLGPVGPCSERPRPLAATAPSSEDRTHAVCGS
jgi:hypothetical protein